VAQERVSLYTYIVYVYPYIGLLERQVGGLRKGSGRVLAIQVESHHVRRFEEKIFLGNLIGVCKKLNSCFSFV
jgi:hypothetical protein